MERITNERLKQISNDAWLCAQDTEVEALARELLAYRESGALKVLRGSFHALRSYQYGNVSTELAEEVADACESAIAKLESIEK